MSALSSTALKTRTSWMPKWIPPASCKLWLPGQDDAQSATIRDRSGSGYNGTITGATWTRRGNGLWELTYAGNDYVDCTNGTALNFTTGAFTIIAWIYPTNLTADNLLFCRGLAGADGYYFYISSTGALYLRTCQLGANQTSNSTVADIAINTQYFIAATRSGAAGKVFQNVSGVVTDMTTTSGTHINPLTCARTAKIGIYDDAASAGFKGRMAFQVRAMDTALTTTELQGIFDQERHLLGV